MVARPWRVAVILIVRAGSNVAGGPNDDFCGRGTIAAREADEILRWHLGDSLPETMRPQRTATERKTCTSNP